MSLSPGKGQLVPPEGTAPVLLHRPTRSLSSNVVRTQPSPRGTAVTYMSVRTGPTVAARSRLTRAVRGGGAVRSASRGRATDATLERSMASRSAAERRLGRPVGCVTCATASATTPRTRPHLDAAPAMARALLRIASLTRSVRLFFSR